MENEANAILQEDGYYTMDDGIDPLELVGVLLQHWLPIVLCFLIGALLAGSITFCFIKPEYEATSMVYIYSKTTSVTSLADLQIGSRLATDFQIVASTHEVMNEVIEKLDLTMTCEELKKLVSVTNPKGSHILKIQVTASSPSMAAQISNTLADVLRTHIADVMNTDEPSVVERAVVPSTDSGLSVMQNAAVWGAGMAFLALLVYSVIYRKDDTIKNEEDVKRHLNMNILAAIPAERAAAPGRRTAVPRH